MVTHILVPLDGSELAERALLCAERLADATDATLHLVRVVEPPAAVTPAGQYAPVNVYGSIIEVEWQEAEAYLDRLRERVSAPGRAVSVARLDGHVAATLLDFERTAGIDLVVLCSHGRTGLVRFALGSVADRLLRHGTAPLLLVRTYGPPVTLAHAVVPLDGSDCGEAALPVLEALRAGGAGRRPVVETVTLLRVVQSQEEGPEAERYLTAVHHRLQRDGAVQGGEATCACRVVAGDPAQAIIDAAGSHALVLMATHGRAGLTRWALGSVADRVAHGGAAAVLLVRAGTTSPAAR